ncbi:MAG: glycosyltransferase family 4 protein [Anaerolineae bacterium]|nr:glycosyltransferase family 4 protein [Anaerolineae bacterium]
MRIGFDVSQTGANKAGCGYVAFSMIQHLARLDHDNHYILYSNFGSDFWDPDHKQTTFRVRQPNFERRFMDFSHSQARAYWPNPPADFEKQLGEPHIVHSNNYFCPRDLRTARLVYTLYDLVYVCHPEFTTEENRLVCFNGVFEASLRADMMIAISEYTKQHFLETFPHYPAERIRVLYPASRFALTNAIDNQNGQVKKLPPGAFWLSVGTLEPRKNLRRLLQAYASLRREGLTTLPLAMAGGKGWLEEGLSEYITNLGIEKDVHLLGYVSDAQLCWLYRNCFAFVYPSLFEGFGMPVLEAMSLGAAVITANVTSLPEITGDAALAIDPLDQEALTAAMARLQADDTLHATLQQRALTRSALFSWEKTAREVLEVYKLCA